MPKRDDDLFQRLRLAGIRKPVAQALSELTDDAGKKAVGAGHKAVAELRALIEEIEKRLPVPKFVSQTLEQVAPASPTPRRASKPRATPSSAKPAPAARARKATTEAAKPVRKAAAKVSATPARAKASKPSTATAPRGQNKAKILSALSSGPRTASEISEKTGIATTTVSSALNRLAKTGEVSKASRGYALPK